MLHTPIVPPVTGNGRRAGLWLIPSGSKANPRRLRAWFRSPALEVPLDLEHYLASYVAVAGNVRASCGEFDRLRGLLQEDRVWFDLAGAGAVRVGVGILPVKSPWRGSGVSSKGADPSLFSTGLNLSHK